MKNPPDISLEGGTVCRWIREWFERVCTGVCERLQTFGLEGREAVDGGGTRGVMLVISGQVMDALTAEVYSAGSAVLFESGNVEQLQFQKDGARVLAVLEGEEGVLLKAVDMGQVSQQFVEDREFGRGLDRVLRNPLQMGDPPWMGKEWDTLHLRELLLYTHKMLRRRRMSRQEEGSVWSMGAKILKLLEGRMHENLNIQQAAAELGLSGRQLTRLLHRTTGCGYVDNLNRIRLFAARQKLIHRRQSVESIAYDCGFGTVHHFIRTFRLWFGLTPLQFRKRFYSQGKSSEDWDSLLCVVGSEPAEWISPVKLGIEPYVTPDEGEGENNDGCHVLYIGNARPAPVSLIRLDDMMIGSRQRLLEPGGLEALVCMPHGSVWRVENEKRELLGGFRARSKKHTLVIVRDN